MSSAKRTAAQGGTRVQVLSVDAGLLSSLRGEERALVESMVGRVYPVLEVQASGHVVVEASAPSANGYTIIQRLALAASEFKVAHRAA